MKNVISFFIDLILTLPVKLSTTLSIWEFGNLHT